MKDLLRQALLGKTLARRARSAHPTGRRARHKRTIWERLRGCVSKRTAWDRILSSFDDPGINSRSPRLIVCPVKRIMVIDEHALVGERVSRVLEARRVRHLIRRGLTGV